MKSLNDRQQRGYTYTTSGANYGTYLFDMGSLSQRTYQVGNIIAYVQIADLLG